MIDLSISYRIRKTKVYIYTVALLSTKSVGPSLNTTYRVNVKKRLLQKTILRKH